MGAYNFKPQFEADIMADRKLHTIRAKRRHPDKPGSLLSLFVGLRTKKCRLLKRRRCTRVQDITIEIDQLTDGVSAVWITIEGAQYLRDDEAAAFARSDGFSGPYGLFDFAQFWVKNHKADKKPFHGDLIHWESDAEYLERTKALLAARALDWRHHNPALWRGTIHDSKHRKKQPKRS